MSTTPHTGKQAAAQAALDWIDDDAIVGVGTGSTVNLFIDALAAAQIPLMDSADTSHPYYWSGFAVVGDGSQPLTAASPGARQ